MTGAQLRELRERYGWTRTQLGKFAAEAAGRDKPWSQRSVAGWELDESKVPAGVVAFLTTLDSADDPEPPDFLKQQTGPGEDTVPGGGGPAPVEQSAQLLELWTEGGPYAKICEEMWEMVATGVGMVGAAIGSQQIRQDGAIIHADKKELGKAWGKLAATNETFRKMLVSSERQGAYLAVALVTGSTVSKIWANHQQYAVPEGLHVVEHAEPPAA